MKKVTTLFLVFMLSVSLFPQAFNWEWLNPKPNGNTLNSVKVLGTNTLVAFGTAGIIAKSTDGGTTWNYSVADTAGREFKKADFVSPLVGYVCGLKGLLMKTTDGGASMNYINIPTTEYLYAVDFIDANTGFVGGANGYLAKTTDGGANWQTVTSPYTTSIYAVCAITANNIFIGGTSTGGLYHSTDGGATWALDATLLTTKTIWDIFFLDANTGWVATQNSGAVYRTTDGGVTWTSSTVNSLMVPNSVKFKDANTGYVTHNAITLVTTPCFKSTDGGVTWTGLNTLTDVLYSTDYDGTDIYTVGKFGNISKSTDNGDIWVPKFSAVTTTQLRMIKFTSSSVGYVAGGTTSSGFLLKTINGGTTWDNVGKDFLGQVYSFDVVNADVWYAGTGTNKLFKTTDAGATFVEQTQSVIVSTSTDYNDMGFVDANNGYAVSSGGGIIKTTDGGTTWVTGNTPFGTTGIWAVKVFNPQKVIAVGASAKAYITTDGGTSWNALTTGIAGSFFCMKFLNDNFGVIGGYTTGPQASKTTDGGATWTALTFPSAYDGNSIWSIGFKDENTFWLGDINGNIYFTTDGGANWTSSKKVTSNTIFSMAVVGDDMWLSGTGGTIIKGHANPATPVELMSFSSTIADNKVNLIWKTATEKNNSGFDIERKLESKNWTKIGFVKGQGSTTEASTYTFVDTPNKNGKISYRLKQVDFDGSYTYSDAIQVDLTIPVEFSLAQNYPNPFNPVTTINYSLAARSKVELKVYNILGKQVMNLVNQTQEAGNYKVEFDASKLASGVYFYELNAGQFSAKKKMVLLK
ncbi:MAG: YCF48-related protein [Ignavibacteriaceae bacterium]|nr:YCF48-related protein [Ignavibacteriaceae bacterium]